MALCTLFQQVKHGQETQEFRSDRPGRRRRHRRLATVFRHGAKAGRAGLPLEELRQLADVFGLIKSDYVEPVEDKKLLTEAISGMVASLDPHSAYLDKKAYAELREGSQGKFVGLGIEIGQSEDGYIKIVAPIEDSPAWRAGIKAGDLITRLDSTPSRA